MARKKKSETKVEEQPSEEDACFIPFENGFLTDTAPQEETEKEIETYTADETQTATVTLNGSESSAIPTPSSINAPYIVKEDMDEVYEEYARKISHAFDVLETCNLYMWAGLDWGTGRVYEMARKEWANYIIAMYDWSDGKFSGIEPVMPSELKEF